MKVLFIVRDIMVFERFGVMSLAAVLRQHGHTVDFCYSLREDPDQFIAAFQPAVVAYSLTTSFHTYYLELNRQLKERHQFFAIFGGPHATFFPDIINHEGVDAVCRGEGEGALLDLVAALAAGRGPAGILNLTVKTDGQVHTAALRPLIANLDDLPFPDREIVYRKSPSLARQKVKSFMSGRGCPYQCSYCFNREYNRLYRGLGKITRQRSPENVIAEIRAVRERYPLAMVRFMDDTFLIAPREWLREFSQLYRRDIALPFFCMGRFELVSEENAALLREAGCVSMYCAIEAGNERIRNRIATRNQSREQILAGSRLLHRAGIAICAENIIGFPTENVAEMLETVELNIAAGIDCAIASVLTPFPGTLIATIAQEHKCFSPDYTNLPDSFYEGTPLNYSPREKKQIARLRGLFNIMVAFPALFRLRGLLLNLPLAPVYDVLASFLHMYLMRFRISPVRMTLRETLETILLFMQMRKNEQ